MSWFEPKAEKAKIPPAKALWAICPKCGSHNVGVWKELDDGHCYDCDFEGFYDQFWH